MKILKLKNYEMPFKCLHGPFDITGKIQIGNSSVCDLPSIAGKQITLALINTCIYKTPSKVFKYETYKT